jgi:hypothetical protein
MQPALNRKEATNYVYLVSRLKAQIEIEAWVSPLFEKKVC